MSDWGVGWKELIRNEENEVHEGSELDCLAVTGALDVFERPEADVESQCDQVDDLTGFRIGVDGRWVHVGVDNAEGDGLLSFDRRV